MADNINPKILHRIYFDDMPPNRDPFGRFLETWKRQLPDYKIMMWNRSNLDLEANEWVRRAAKANSPVFLSEYFRWWALSEFGGIYLDADCEILDGAKLATLADDVFASSDYDAAIGVEEYQNGHPTAQSMIARKDSELVAFMLRMYSKTLSGPLWHWREERGLIGPQLISLYFRDQGFTEHKGFFCRLDAPIVQSRVKVYPQDYFSPKFTIDGTHLNYTDNTCVYHLFANLNMQWDDATKEKMRQEPMLFEEYRGFLKGQQAKSQELLAPMQEAVTDAASVTALVERTEDAQSITVLGTLHKKLKRIQTAIGPALGGKSRSLKTLHRIYFGFDGKPDSLTGYLDSWRRELPDYEIKAWNADNLPMDLNEYTKDLAKARDHAFLTDYFRWWVLREYGGTYLDADVEVVNGGAYNQLINELELAKDYDAFIGIDEKGGGWYTAHSMASKPGSALAAAMCEVYEKMGPIRAWRKRAFYLWAPQLTALYFYRNGHNVEGMGTSPNLVDPKVVAGVKIYPQDYFSPVTPIESGTSKFTVNGVTQNTSLCHHFACSWHEDSSPYASHAAQFRSGPNTLLKEIVDEKLAAAGTRRLGIGAKFPYPASHPAMRSEIAMRVGNTFVLDGHKEGTAIYGPYINLPPGRYLAKIFFAPDAPLHGHSVLDVASDGGRLRLAYKVVDQKDQAKGDPKVEFVVPDGGRDVEVRLFCAKGFVGTIEGIEFEAI